MGYPYTYGRGRYDGQYPIPEVYDEALSYQQQIARINSIIHRLDSERLTMCDLNALRNELRALINDMRDDLIRKIVETESGNMDWDVTTGWYQTSPTAMTRLFNDLAVHAITVDDLAQMNMTVDQLANCGLNCYGLAVWSGEAFSNDSDWEPDGINYKGANVRKALTCEILSKAQVQDGFFVEGV